MAQHASTGSRGVRPVLWLLLAVSLTANVVASTADINMLVGPAFGLVALACAAALIVHSYRHRRP